jgi:AcrR family transcriptional regulator
MARPRSYEEHTVVIAAQQVFWDNGLAASGIADLEAGTGLNRSSLYTAFGSKRGLFDAALGAYLDDILPVFLGPLEAPEAGLAEAAGFFLGLGEAFTNPRWQRGCLMINSMAELAGRDPSFAAPAAQFADRLRAAFSNALHGAVGQGALAREDVTRRSEMLAAATLGLWLAVRADPSAAAATCREVAAEVISWDRSGRSVR